MNHFSGDEGTRLERLLADSEGDSELRDLCAKAAQSLVGRAAMADVLVSEQPVAEVLTERMMSMARPELALVLGLLGGRRSRTILRSWLNTCDAAARKDVNKDRAAP